MTTGLELDTRSKLLKAAVTIFGKYGFAGASVRQIADLAGVNHGSIKYHYSSKDDLWRAAVSYLYNLMETEVHQDEDLWEKMTPRERLVSNVTKYVRFHAKHPELQRIVIFETIHESERFEWLNENFIRPFTDRAINSVALAQEQGVYKDNIPVFNQHYINIAAARTIFLMASEIQHNFGIDVFHDAEIDRHIDALIKLFMVPLEETDSSSDHIDQTAKTPAQTIEDLTSMLKN